jgi:hypothetical protein
VLLRTTRSAPPREPSSAQPLPWITQLSTMNCRPAPETRIGPTVDWIVAPLQRSVLLAASAYSSIV